MISTENIRSLLNSKEKITQDWSWWNEFLQRSYYGGSDESASWNGAERALVADLNLQPGMSVLDLGSGSGELEFRLGMRGMKVVGVEHSEPLVATCQRIARDKGIPVSFVAANMFAYSPEQQFDVILSINTSFGYGSDQENRQLIRNIASWLRPGGAFYLDLLVADNVRPFGVWSDYMADGTLIVDNTWNKQDRTMISWPYWLSEDETVLYAAPAPEQVRLYTIGELEEMMNEAGLEVRKLQTGLGRRLRQEGKNMLRTWIARKPLQNAGQSASTHIDLNNEE